MYTTEQKKDLESLRNTVIYEDVVAIELEKNNFFKKNLIDIINCTIDNLYNSSLKSLEKFDVQFKELFNSMDTNIKSVEEIEKDTITCIRDKIMTLFGEDNDNSPDQMKMYQIKTYIDSSDATICNLDVYELAKNSQPFLIPIEQFYLFAGFSNTHPLRKFMSKFATFSDNTIERMRQEGIPDIALKTYSYSLVTIDTEIIEWLGYKGKTGYTAFKRELKRRKISFNELKREDTILFERSKAISNMLSVVKDADKMEDFINFNYIGPKYIEYQNFFQNVIRISSKVFLKNVEFIRKLISAMDPQISSIKVQNSLLLKFKSSMEDVRLLRVLEEQKLKNVIEREKDLERANVELDIKLHLLEREKDNVKKLREELAEDYRKNIQRKRSRR